MPIYEYRCEQCGDFEEMQRITDPPLERCPTCRHKVRRLISSTSFHLKGSGWYVTDYPRGAAGNGKKKEGGESTPSAEAGAPSASDKKSEKKAESSGTSEKTGT